MSFIGTGVGEPAYMEKRCWRLVLIGTRLGGRYVASRQLKCELVINAPTTHMLF